MTDRAVWQRVVPGVFTPDLFEVWYSPGSLRVVLRASGKGRRLYITPDGRCWFERDATDAPDFYKSLVAGARRMRDVMLAEDAAERLSRA